MQRQAQVVGRLGVVRLQAQRGAAAGDGGAEVQVGQRQLFPHKGVDGVTMDVLGDP